METKTSTRNTKMLKNQVQRYLKTSMKTITPAIILLLLNIILKTYKIEKGDAVVWDEAHFGKFGSKYLKREFYFDVHPPLGKMMTALSGYIYGQHHDFEFKSSTKYPENMDYVGMRRFHAFVGSFIPLFAYGLLLELGYSIWISFFFSLLFVFENGFCSISRLILLDSHLMFFTAASAYFLTKFYRSTLIRKHNFMKESLNLLYLGISIGCVSSVKWIGCLTTCLIGFYIIFELWNILMSNEQILKFIKKFVLRAVFLIVVPIAIYLLCFLLHFLICNTSSTEEAHMSSLFQSQLKNSSLNKTMKYVPYGKLLTIKSSRVAGGNLHSHADTYPGTDIQQITTYFHKDQNNHWALQKILEDNGPSDYVHEGDQIVILHFKTKAYLSIDDKAGYITQGKRVNGIKDGLALGSVWIVEIESDLFQKESKLKTLTTRFRLKNKQTGLYLSSTGENYPTWGHKQGEVVCIEEKDSSTLWNIEENVVEKEEHEEYKEIKQLKRTFIKHVVELNKAMYNSNKSLTQDKDLEPAIMISMPYEWFILKRGLRMNSWDDDKYKFYMFGNPIIWYTSSLCVILTPIILLIRTIYCSRKYGRLLKSSEYFEVYLCFGGWAIHYLPFFLIGRVLYFHHYFPAYFFAILSINYVRDKFRIPHEVFVCFVIAAISSYFYFAPLTYGFYGPTTQIAKKLWIKTWTFV